MVTVPGGSLVPKIWMMIDMNKINGESISLSYQMLARSNYIALAFKMIVFVLAQGIWRMVEPSDADSAVE